MLDILAERVIKVTDSRVAKVGNRRAGEREITMDERELNTQESRAVLDAIRLIREATGKLSEALGEGERVFSLNVEMTTDGIGSIVCAGTGRTLPEQK